VDSNFGDAMASTPQSRDRLENGRGKNDEMPGGMWKTVEASTREVRIGKVEGGRSKKRNRKEKEKERKEKETEEGQDSGS